MPSTIVKQERHSLSHRRHCIYYDFLPRGGGEIQVVRTGKVGHSWRTSYILPVEEARALWCRLKQLNYEEF